MFTKLFGKLLNMGGGPEPVGGRVQHHDFGIRCVTGDVIDADVNFSPRTPIEYVLMLFPHRQLREMVQMTNKELLKLRFETSKRGEILKFIGVLKVCSLYEFGERRSL